MALSNITVLGGALANLTVNLFRRHPILNRPLVDWDLLLVMEPTTILGKWPQKQRGQWAV